MSEPLAIDFLRTHVMARFTGKTHDAAAFARSLRRDGDWTDATVDFLIEGAGKS